MPSPRWSMFETAPNSWYAVDVPGGTVADVRDSIDPALRVKVRGETRPYYGNGGKGSLYEHTGNDALRTAILVHSDVPAIHL